MIRMSHDRNIVVQSLQEVLGVGTGDGGGLCDLLVDHDVHLDALLGFALEQTVNAPVLRIDRRTAEVEFRGEPPVENPDGLFGFFEDLRDGVEIVVGLEVPFLSYALT